MLMDLKPWLCTDPGQEYEAASIFGRVRLGDARLFWKNGLRRYAVDMTKVLRVWRQEENVYGRLCGGGRSYVIHRLVLCLEDGKQLTVHIGDDEKAAAQSLLTAIAERFPQIAIGKE